ncbi:MAG: ABC transporter ATP-binding protein [Lachnospiraceae bacterium]|nr:ABC transporter ATP-binding protein [Lachnospiraceae bacterium]
MAETENKNTDNTELEQKEAAIAVKNLTKIYKLYSRNRDRVKEALHLTRKTLHKDHYALSSIDMNIYKGETVGIIGTNGSGKSTILKIITGVLSPSEGEVIVDGRISALLELGAGFNMEYTGIENVYLNGTMIGFSKEEIDAKLDSILEFADIGDFVNQPVKTYSSGMFVRLAFAVAINIDPEILIVDEALSVGDVFFQAKCYRKFDEFKAAGKTILFVSHDLSSIAKYCDRVILLDKGKKLGEGAPKQMIDIYKQVLVGQYNAEKKKGKKDGNQAPVGVNPEELDYGSGKAEIYDCYIKDENGLESNAIIKGSRFTIGMKVRFKEDCSSPIFAYTIKNSKGTEITGTNTMFEKTFLENVKAGEDKEITFTQEMTLQGGDYLLSFGCTGYENNNFTVYHRRYDAIDLMVISEKNTVGYFDMNSEIAVQDTKES